MTQGVGKTKISVHSVTQQISGKFIYCNIKYHIGSFPLQISLNSLLLPFFTMEKLRERE